MGLAYMPMIHLELGRRTALHNADGTGDLPANGVSAVVAGKEADEEVIPPKGPSMMMWRFILRSLLALCPPTVGEAVAVAADAEGRRSLATRSLYYAAGRGTTPQIDAARIANGMESTSPYDKRSNAH